ncbi:MAG TPA: putative baseplate assembly protein, partial [Gemmatimonadaceae bacterium]|nr:putative baseplate assembly protein [Gemmatimonadaceae bacterium]
MSCDCGCCSVVSLDVEPGNRPWLSAVAYRIGTFSSFRRAIVDELSRTPELAGLTARVSDDYTISAIELWAAVADVLTFYQERIANEAFLRTATLRDSVLRLVRLIDYQLGAGAAATTQLAFTLDVGARALIPRGTRAQSVPAEGEKPQKFETLIDLLGDARLNRLRLFPAAVAASPTSAGSASAILAPDGESVAAAATLATGDRVVLYAPTALETLTVRDLTVRDDLMTVRWATPIAGSAFGAVYTSLDPARRLYRLGRSFHLFGHDAPEVVVVPALAVATDPTTTYLTQARTDYTLHGDGSTTSPPQISLDARYAGLTPGSIVLAVATLASGTRAIPFTVIAAGERMVSRKATPIPKPSGPPIDPVTSQSGTVTQLTLTPLGPQSLGDLLPTGDIRDVVIHELLGAPLRFWPYTHPGIVASSDVYLAGRRNGWSSIEVGRSIEKGAYKPGVTVDIVDLPAGRAALLTDASGAAPADAVIAGASLAGLDIAFAPTDTDTVTISKLGLAPAQVTAITALVSAPLPATVPVPVGPRQLQVTIGSLPPQTIALPASLPATATRAQIATAMQAALRAALPSAPSFAQARVFPVPSDAIAIVPGAPSDRVSVGPSAGDAATIVALGFDPARVRWLDGVLSAPIVTPAPVFSGAMRVRVGIDAPTDRTLSFLPLSVPILALQLTLFWGYGAAAREDRRLIVLPPVPAREPRAFIHLSLGLDAPVMLDAASAVLLGNVAPASHGETVHGEVLGDGDAARAFQRFALRKKPLTFVPAAIPGGVASSLALLVNGVRWREVPTLYGARPDDQVYTTRLADDATTTVQFGDGVTGARPPTGRQNIVATYRQGIGVAGRVKAGTITTLLDRATGVKNVVNLRGADGGADAETMDKARQAAPGTVRTFGRAVSLRDFEDTALMAGEVAKASATWVWSGERRAIHLTIAAQGGATFSADGLRRIAATLLSERDPNHKLLIDNYSAVAVLVDASIIVDGRYVTADVLAAARSALELELAFDRRRFGQPVYLSEIFAVLQNVAGVMAVDVNTLDLKSTDPAFRAAHGIDPALGQPQPRLRILPA